MEWRRAESSRVGSKVWSNGHRPLQTPADPRGMVEHRARPAGPGPRLALPGSARARLAPQSHSGRQVKHVRECEHFVMRLIGSRLAAAHG